MCSCSIDVLSDPQPLLVEKLRGSDALRAARFQADSPAAYSPNRKLSVSGVRRKDNEKL